jgi:uncharacterized protein (TIGR03083 family)
MNHAEYTDAAVAEIERMAGTVRDADVELAIPTCPGWDLRQLIRHTGTVHRWAAALVERRSPERIDPKSLDKHFPDDDAGWPDWLAAGAGILGEALHGATGDEPMWSWGADQHARFWSRRQLHETVVHHADAAIALGMTASPDARIAIDGIDELLDNLPTAAYFAPGIAELKGAGESIHLHATDGDGAGEWMIELGSDGFHWAHGHGKGTVAVRGPAAHLLLMMYRRVPLDELRGVR